MVMDIPQKHLLNEVINYINYSYIINSSFVTATLILFVCKIVLKAHKIPTENNLTWSVSVKYCLNRIGIDSNTNTPLIHRMFS